MKKAMMSILAVGMAMSLGACGGAQQSEKTSAETEVVTETATATEAVTEDAGVTETNYSKLNGIYVDKSYTDKENEKLKMVYVFYDVFSNDQNLKISSKYSNIKVNDVNEYSSETYQGACDFMGSYYFSDYIEEVYVGDTLKVASTFLIPEGELVEGRTLEITPYGIPESDKFLVKTDDIVYCDSAEAVAQDIDQEGYAAYQEKHEAADEETVAKVKAAINGYQWDFYVNSTSYQIEFFDPNAFEVRVSALNVNNGGSYVIKKGFISCTYDSNGNTVDIPWSWGESDIELDVTTAFDVH